MAIKNLADRYPELGRIRLGDKEVVYKNGTPLKNKDGTPKERPKKGEFLKFTSNDETALNAIASQHGGDVAPWEKGEQAFHLTSETKWIEALLPVDPLADTPIYERWGSGGVQRRCDGERCTFPVGSGDGGHLEEGNCMCLAEGLTPGDAKDTKTCKVTMRIRLVLPYVPGIGVWLCTSHSWLGALELPGQVAVIESMRQRGQLIPVLFGIEERTVKKPWEQYRRDFIVPSVRISQSLAQLQGSTDMLPPLNRGTIPAIVASATPALAAAAAPIRPDEILTSDGDPGPQPPGTAGRPTDTPDRFHKVGAAKGLDEEERRAIILDVTIGRTNSAGECAPDELAAAFKAQAEYGATLRAADPAFDMSVPVTDIRLRCKNLSKDALAEYTAFKTDQRLPSSKDIEGWTPELVQLAVGMLDEIEGEQAKAAAKAVTA